jgi:UDP-N-acetyl-D-glucosamine dehydrogenase
MPAHVVRRVAMALATKRKKLKGTRILLLGIAYKANVDDDRESPAYAIWNLLEAAGTKVAFHDPHIPVIRPSREHAHFAGRRSIALTRQTIASAHVVLIVTPHNAVNYSLVAKHARLVVDSRNVLAGLLRGKPNYFKA